MDGAAATVIAQLEPSLPLLIRLLPEPLFPADEELLPLLELPPQAHAIEAVLIATKARSDAGKPFVIRPPAGTAVKHGASKPSSKVHKYIP